MARTTRRFDPTNELGNRPPSTIIKHYPSEGLSFLSDINSPISDISDFNSIVVAIDGACPGNGTDSAKGAYGIYFGRNSPYNKFGLLSPAFRQTNNAAELEAARKAVHTVLRNILPDSTAKELILMTDS